MAWSEEYANSVGIPEGEDRVLGRWEPPGKLRPGWQHAVTILVVRESLGLQRPEKRLNTVAFFPPPNPGDVLGFRVLLGAANSALEVTGAVEVGTLQLPSGGMIGVCMRSDPITLELTTTIREVRAQMLSAVTAVGARGNQAFAWGRFDNGAVCLLDPGVVEPEGAAPDGSTQAGPGRLTYVRQVDPSN